MGDQSLATPARDGLTSAREGQTPDRVEQGSPDNSGERENTLRLPRQVGEARNSNATQSTVARNLNLNFPGDGNFAQEYSPRRPQRESAAPERSDPHPPQNSIFQGTEVPVINNKNLNFQKVKNSRLVEFAATNDFTGPEESTQADLDSAASFRDHVA